MQGLQRGKAQIGNDSPFMPAYPSTDSSIVQREMNIAEARQLMEAAGMSDGFKATLTTEKYLEIPDYALIQNAVKEIGGDIALNIMDQGAYYGDAVPGKSPGWLEMGITDYGHRGVPNVFPASTADQHWHLEFGAFRQQRVRYTGGGLYRIAGSGCSPRSSGQDPDPAAR